MSFHRRVNIGRALHNSVFHGKVIVENIELSPALENLIFLIWLILIHTKLSKFRKQTYGTELRCHIKPRMSQALDSLLDKNHTTEHAKVMHAVVSYFSKPM